MKRRRQAQWEVLRHIESELCQNLFQPLLLKMQPHTCQSISTGYSSVITHKEDSVMLKAEAQTCHYTVWNQGMLLTPWCSLEQVLGQYPTTFFGEGCSPSLFITCPKYSISFSRKWHFASFNLRPNCCNLLNTFVRFSLCSSKDLPLIKMSSK